MFGCVYHSNKKGPNKQTANNKKQDKIYSIMNNQLIKTLIIGLLICLLYSTFLYIIKDSKPEKIDYKLELINQTDVKLMDENGETLHITTLDSIEYYIEQDNL
jgi:hypothetical protein